MVSLDIHAILTNPGIEECIFYAFQARTENDSVWKYLLLYFYIKYISESVVHVLMHLIGQNSRAVYKKT